MINYYSNSKILRVIKAMETNKECDPLGACEMYKAMNIFLGRIASEIKKHIFGQQLPLFSMLISCNKRIAESAKDLQKSVAQLLNYPLDQIISGKIDTCLAKCIIFKTRSLREAYSVIDAIELYDVSGDQLRKNIIKNSNDEISKIISTTANCVLNIEEEGNQAKWHSLSPFYF